LAIDTRSPEELFAHYREDKHSWIVIIKHEASTSGKPDLKVKNMDRKEDSDIRSSDLLSHLRGEIRTRDGREGTNERARLLRQPSHPGTSLEKKGNVQVLMAGHKSKKANKWRLVEAAQAGAHDLLQSFADGPIASIETRDDVLDMIRETRLSDPESWRKVTQAVQLSERQYVQEVQDLLITFKIQHAEMSRNAFVYNFRTGKCIYYDLLL